MTAWAVVVNFASNTEQADAAVAEIQRFADAIPPGRLGPPADIADVVAFLAGPDDHWINGQLIRANGGLV